MNYKQLMAKLAKRNEEIRRLRLAGWKLKRLVAKYGITKQRVSQIANAK